MYVYIYIYIERERERESVTTHSQPCKYYPLWVQWALITLNLQRTLRGVHTYILLRTFSPI